MRRLVGNPAPDFKMTAAKGDGSGFEEVSLEGYKGKWLVFFFYPRDFTFVCPTELRSINSVYKGFVGLDAEVLACSTDSEYSHQAWLKADAESGGLGLMEYPIAADTTQKVADAYGVLDKETGAAYRGLFIIDPEGVIQYEVVHNLDIGRNAKETLRVLKALQSGGLCPANWAPGESTL